MLYTVMGIFVVVFAIIFVVLIIIADNEEEKEYIEQVKQMKLNKDKEKKDEKKVLRTDHIYTDDEVDDIREWLLDREYFKAHNYKDIRQKKCWADTFGPAISVGIVVSWWAFWPMVAVWYLAASWHNPVFTAFSIDNIETGGIMLMIVSCIICFLAVLGVCSIWAWIKFLGSDKEERDWYKEEIEKSEKICDCAIQEAEKPLKEEINNLYNQLGDSEAKYEKLKVEHNKLQKEYDEKENNYTSKLNSMKEEYNREKRLWALEKKELQYQIKLKQGLATEMEDAESPLGGLYN